MPHAGLLRSEVDFAAGMSGSRRRSPLMAIFYYRNPDARARRVQKMIDEAVTMAERRRA
jgi:hypothetical protein